MHGCIFKNMDFVLSKYKEFFPTRANFLELLKEMLIF